MSLKTSKIAPTPKERFIKGLIMAMHSETLILSESERSIYKFILDHKNNLNSLIRGRPHKMWWRIW
jgi:hypothetical protein